eukprot:PhM_4_TR9942/c0_g1_i1/m.60435
MSTLGEGHVFVLYATEAKTHRYKMLLNRDVGSLTMSKVKKYLAKTTGVPEQYQVLRLRGRVVPDAAKGADIGLHSGDEMAMHVSIPMGGTPATTHTEEMEATSRPSTSPKSSPPPMPTPQGVPRRAEDSSNNQMKDDIISHQQQLQQASSNRIASLEQENEALRQHVANLQRELRDTAASAARVTGSPLAERALALLSRSLDSQPPLAFDANTTCSLTVKSTTVLITYDMVTQRLYVYSTLLNALPRDAVGKVTLYEMLLEGSLLGRDVVGGAVGISLRNDVVLLSTSVDLMHSDEAVLRDVVPQFVECVTRWRSMVRDVMAN